MNAEKKTDTMRTRLSLYLAMGLVPLTPAASQAQSVMSATGISTTGFVSASQIITTNVSFTTGATTWGYISSTGTYLPKLATDRISTTSISTTNLTANNLTLSGTPTASTDAATKAYVDTVIAATCSGASSGNSACQVGRTWKTLGNFGVNTTAYPVAVDNNNNVYGWASDGSNYYIYKNTTKIPTIYQSGNNKLGVSADGQKMIMLYSSGSVNYVYTSTDSASTWTDRTKAIVTAMGYPSASYLGAVYALAISGDGSRMLASGYPYGSSSTMRTLISSDGGATWSIVLNTNTINSTLSYDGTVILAGYATNNQISRNSGGTWSTVNPTGAFSSAMSPNGMNIVSYTPVGPSSCAPMFSKDGGSTWTTAMDVFDSAVCGNSQVMGATNDGMYMQVGSYYSLDGGNTWTKSTTPRTGLFSLGNGKVFSTFSYNSLMYVQVSECP